MGTRSLTKVIQTSETSIANEDNNNETFYVHGVDGDEIELMVIFNRWGEKIHETTSNEPWDGENCQIGVYTYSIRTHNQHYTGQINLIR